MSSIVFESPIWRRRVMVDSVTFAFQSAIVVSISSRSFTCSGLSLTVCFSAAAKCRFIHARKRVSTSSPLIPRAVPFDQLALFARALLAPLTQNDLVEMARDSDVLCQALFDAAIGDIVELRVREPAGCVELSERPQSHALARGQARKGSRLSTKFSQVVELNDLHRQIVVLLDGARDRTALVNHLVGLIADGSLNIEIDDSPVTNAEQVRQLMAQEVDYTLRHLANHGLLTGTGA